MPASKDDLETVEKALPYIRSILAFIYQIRFARGVPDSYVAADEFINQLKRDLNK
jgi:hypothetical protein